jgi:hypothetical protein
VSRGTALRLLVGWLTIAVGPLAAPLGAQEVRFSGQPEGDAQRELVRFLEEEAYTVWTRDTVLARGVSVPGNLLILEAAVRIAGEVQGDVWVVDVDFFLRPAGRIAGDVTVLGGGFYSSQLAQVEGETEYRSLERLRVMPEDGGYVVFAALELPPAIELDGQYGFHLPIYERVNAVTLGWGGTGRLLDVPWRPELSVTLRYRTGPAKFEGSLAQYWNPSARFRFGIEAGRTTESNEAWIRRQWVNSLFFFITGDDFRDYYRADRVAAALEFRPRPEIRVRFAGRWEEARSLDARDVTVLFGPDTVRANPSVERGDTYGVSGSVEFERVGRGSRTAASVTLEGASADVAGDFSFLHAEGQFGLRRTFARRHGLELFAIGRGDLAGRLPSQRWSAIGGIGTLPTLPILSRRGPRLLFAEATYAFSVFGAGGFGSADLLLRGSLGSAWSEGATPRFEENVSLAARVLGVELGVAFGPSTIGGDWEGRAFLDVRFARGPRLP